MADRYILHGKTAVAVDDATWARWFVSADRRVAWTEIGGHVVSTVFLGINHQFGDEGPPLIFETMIFGAAFSGDDEYQTRCSTWDEAEAMHRAAIEVVKGKMN